MSFVSLPAETVRHFVLANATVPLACTDHFHTPGKEGLALVDITLDHGKVQSILPAGATPSDLPRVDLQRGMVWPCFTDMHTHLDKGHIWGRRPNPDGSFMGALNAVHEDSAVNWTADDIRTRMQFSLKSAYAHGTQLIRTHLDCFPPIHHNTTFGVFDEMRAEWKGRIELQGVALFGFDILADTAYFAELVKLVREKNGLLGGFPLMVPQLQAQLDQVFKAAIDNGLDLDLHVDETSDPHAKSLKMIADTALRLGFEGKITVGHCCSLACQDDYTARTTIDAVAKANLAVVSLPMCNMYLQDRHAAKTPHWRGITLIHELQAAGVDVAVSSDNTRDPFYAYGDLDAVEVFRESVRIAHLDHPLTEAARVVTTTPASILRRPELGKIAEGQSADLVLFSARNWSEFLSRPQSNRIVLRGGKKIDSTLPSYRDLDDLKGA